VKHLRIASGLYKGRYVGMKVGFHSTHLYLPDDPALKVPGTKYALFMHAKHAFEFGRFTAPTATIEQAQTDLRVAGYDTEVVNIAAKKYSCLPSEGVDPALCHYCQVTKLDPEDKHFLPNGTPVCKECAEMHLRPTLLRAENVKREVSPDLKVG